MDTLSKISSNKITYRERLERGESPFRIESSDRVCRLWIAELETLWRAQAQELLAEVHAKKTDASVSMLRRGIDFLKERLFARDEETVRRCNEQLSRPSSRIKTIDQARKEYEEFLAYYEDVMKERFKPTAVVDPNDRVETATRETFEHILWKAAEMLHQNNAVITWYTDADTITKMLRASGMTYDALEQVKYLLRRAESLPLSETGYMPVPELKQTVNVRQFAEMLEPLIKFACRQLGKNWRQLGKKMTITVTVRLGEDSGVEKLREAEERLNEISTKVDNDVSGLSSKRRLPFILVFNILFFGEVKFSLFDINIGFNKKKEE